ncbi:MAG: AI-2E family transporter [Myxococcales bacterium]|nr:AI-2E family transporter [Myxococcales bacterium]
MERQRSGRVESVCLVIIATILAGAAIRWLEPVMIPFVLSLFVALGLSSLISWFQAKLRLPHGLAVAATLLVAGLAFTLVGSVVSASIAQLSENAAVYQVQATRLLERLVTWIPEWAQAYLPDGGEALTQLPMAGLGKILLGTTDTVVNLLSKSLLVLIFVIFLLIGHGASAAASGVWAEIESRVQRYIVIKALVSALTGLLIGIVLGTLDVPLAMAFGLLAFLLNFIPSVGSLIATLLPLPVVMISPEVSSSAAVLAIAIPAGIQLLVGNVLEPKWMGASLDLHPVALLMALILWGMLWGIAGMLLATPITAVMKILFEKLESTRPLADVLAGRLAKLRSPGAAA